MFRPVIKPSSYEDEFIRLRMADVFVDDEFCGYVVEFVGTDIVQCDWVKPGDPWTPRFNPGGECNYIQVMPMGLAFDHAAKEWLFSDPEQAMASVLRHLAELCKEAA